MIAFGCIVYEPEPYVAYAAPGIREAAEPDSEVLSFAASGNIARGYNMVLERAATRDDLEALVLLRAHTRLHDPDLCAKVRAVLADPEVALVGCAGARGTQALAWWEGEVRTGDVRVRFEDSGGGEQQAFDWAGARPAPAEVEVLDGSLLILSPWAVRNLRFDEHPLLDHAFAVDFCRQVRAAGRKLWVADLRVVLHRPLGLIAEKNGEGWMLAHQRLAEKWDGPGPADDGAWRPRARRAEAAREAARAMGGFRVLQSQVRVAVRERELEGMLTSPGWRLTAPLRRFNRLLRRGGPSGEGPADLLAGDHRLAGGHARALAQPGEPLGHPERAGLQ